MDYETKNAIDQIQDVIRQVVDKLHAHKVTQDETTVTVAEVVEVLKEHNQRLAAIEAALSDQGGNEA